MNFVVLLMHCAIYDLIYIYDLTQAVANEEISDMACIIIDFKYLAVPKRTTV